MKNTLESVQQSSVVSFEQIYKKNRGKVLRYVQSKLTNRENSEELTSDIFVKIAQHLESFDPEKASFKTWMYRIVINSVIDHLRKKKMLLISIAETDRNNDVDQFTNGRMEETVTISSEDQGPLDLMIDGESIQIIKNAIKTLSPSRQQMITLFSQGVSYAEIASELHLPLGTVKANIHHTRIKLKALLAPQLATMSAH